MAGFFPWLLALVGSIWFEAQLPRAGREATLNHHRGYAHLVVTRPLGELFPSKGL